MNSTCILQNIVISVKWPVFMMKFTFFLLHGNINRSMYLYFYVLNYSISVSRA
jgi:hypothetical protein